VTIKLKEKNIVVMTYARYEDNMPNSDAKLTTAQRKKLRASQFCGPGRSFPVPDCAHYTAALRLLGRAKVSESTRSKIRACVMRKGESLSCSTSDNMSEQQIEDIINSESFDDTHDMIEFMEILDADRNFAATEDQKLRLINQIISVRSEKYGKDTKISDYQMRSFNSLLDTLLDEMDFDLGIILDLPASDSIEEAEDPEEENSNEGPPAPRPFDHSMTISDTNMMELHEHGLTYVEQTDGREKMTIQVKWAGASMDSTTIDSVMQDEGNTFTPPAGAKGNARRVLDWKKKHGSEVKGMTSVGWARARQLASGKPVGLNTVSRMAQFNRHRKNAAVAPEYKSTPWKDAGHVAWLGWGGSTGIDWAIRTMNSQKNNK
jgi:hypothetical protein